jgi:hypothetical protein
MDGDMRLQGTLSAGGACATPGVVTAQQTQVVSFLVSDSLSEETLFPPYQAQTNEAPENLPRRDATSSTPTIIFCTVKRPYLFPQATYYWRSPFAARALFDSRCGIVTELS